MKKMIFGAAAALMLLATGCTGSFRLVQTVHHWHTNFENRWTDELCFLFPGSLFYCGAFIFDTVFLNSVEFWMGDNPINFESETASVTRISNDTAIVTDKATGNVYTVKRAADGSLSMTDAEGNRAVAAL